MEAYSLAIGERYRVEAGAQQAPRQGRTVNLSPNQPKRPMEMTRNPDGSTRTTYNMWAFADSQPSGEKLR